MAHEIVPLDKDGNPSPDGKIVLLTTGMSNTTMESQAFIKLAAAETDLNPHMVILDGAQGGQTARVIANPQANYWKVDEDRLSQAGLSPKQVQAVWLKQANAGPTEPFPTEAKKLEEDIRADIKILTAHFPNLKQVFLSSRIYAGYASTPLILSHMRTRLRSRTSGSSLSRSRVSRTSSHTSHGDLICGQME